MHQNAPFSTQKQKEFLARGTALSLDPYPWEGKPLSTNRTLTFGALIIAPTFQTASQICHWLTHTHTHVMEALCREFRVALPWELLYTDDLDLLEQETVAWKFLKEFCLLTFVFDTHTHTHNTHNCFTALWILSVTIQVSRYQKKQSPIHTRRGSYARQHML